MSANIDKDSNGVENGINGSNSTSENGHKEEQPFGRPEWELLQKRLAVLYDNVRAYHTNLQQLLADAKQAKGNR
ncbi:unnamed protein product [Meloidogyne enterolobii]|uniref:Uncharacterized protein n=2 Tax=Meloidogyne enterolobii TaxID=390850 RepID=A0A6V7WXS0_MELEN|nr:unnamed protein product [Meloidogyne enterolobii]